MYRQGRILVVDDLANWREQIVETLERDGFNADAVSTLAEVWKRLDETFYHILVLDMRLVDDDPNNQEGIDLLRELDRRGLSEAIKVIMLSAYGTQERVRLAFKDYKVADFLSKDEFRSHTFLKSIRQIFIEDVRINLSLEIHWQQVSGPEQVVPNLVEVGGKRLKGKVDPEFQHLIANELDDLLCRLFNETESVLVYPLAIGKSATVVLWAQPFYSNGGGGHAVVVKFGDFRKIEEEYIRFKKYVQPFIGGGRNTTVLDVRRTPHLGGIVYSLLGPDTDHLEDFGSFYQHAEPFQVQRVLDGLFLDTCKAWYANPGRLQPYNLTTDYQQLLEFTQEKLEFGLSKLQNFVKGTGQHKLTFKSLSKERTFTNPLPGMTGPPLHFSTYICTTHGDFNQHNLLVDMSGHTWLIDFQATGQGHILRDVAQLDSEIRFVLLASQEATLDERLLMEEALCSARRFSELQQLIDILPTDNQALNKAYTTVLHLRTLAHKLVAQNPSDDMSEYYTALFYYAVNTLRFFSLPSTQREHALLYASLIADRLGLRG
jgi:CheY-like chemotaxis protein